MNSIFEHKSPNIYSSSDCKFIISPSLIPLFFNNPSEWYRTVFKNEVIFKGNTASLLGTICHYIYDCVNKGIDVNRIHINECLTKHLEDNPDIDADKDDIIRSYPEIASSVVNNYILPAQKNYNSESEVRLFTEVSDNGIYLGGTCDRIENNRIIVDFKTVGKKPNETVIPIGYKLQLLAYAYIYERTYNIKIESIRIVYGVKPQKTIGARCIVVNELLTDELRDLFDKTLELIIKTIELTWYKPEYIPLLYKDMELK